MAKPAYLCLNLLVFPVVLNPAYVRVLVAGRGLLFEKRRDQLVEYLGAAVTVCEVPGDADIRAAQLVFVAGLDEAESARIAATARAAGVLVNVEDVLHLCDFHTPAIVRRGDLLFSVSTNGKSPALAKMLRAFLEAVFPEAWAKRLDTLADMRRALRAQGQGFQEISDKTIRTVEENKWLCTQCRT